eukprot:3586637-Ditylum_brightwellii.AAC.1
MSSSLALRVLSISVITLATPFAGDGVDPISGEMSVQDTRCFHCGVDGASHLSSDVMLSPTLSRRPVSVLSST